jgi:hypothetical protein
VFLKILRDAGCEPPTFLRAPGHFMPTFPPDNFGPPSDSYGAPAEGYGPPTDKYGLPSENFGPPSDKYGPPSDKYGPPSDKYGPPSDKYGPPKDKYGPPKDKYGPPSPSNSYGPPSTKYGVPDKPSSNYGPPTPAAEYGPPSTTPAPIIHKHIYVHVPPPEPEYPAPPRPVEVLPAQKHYRIIFIKAPTQSIPTLPPLPEAQSNEEKTIVYVLVKKPDDAPEISLPTPASTVPSKPEVYFIRYKTEESTTTPPEIVSEPGGYY